LGLSYLCIVYVEECSGNVPPSCSPPRCLSPFHKTIGKKKDSLPSPIRMSSVISYRIVETTQHLFGQLDAILLDYYRRRWPTLMADFTPVTWREPHPHHSPLQMIATSYSIVKTQFPNKQDIDILSAIVLFYYSTVILEYYVLKESNHYTIFLQQKYISDDGYIIVTQDNQLFWVKDSSEKKSPTELIELNKVLLTSTNSSPVFFQMQPEERRETLRSLSKQLREGCLPHQILPHRFFLRRNDLYKFIWSLSDDPEDTFCKTQATVGGFFSQFQNKEINSLVFQISSQEEKWARQIRRTFHGMNESTDIV
jgi:hypothetical protein